MCLPLSPLQGKIWQMTKYDLETKGKRVRVHINTIKDELSVTFVSLRIIVYPAILGTYLPF
jgi:hypothetical protein